MILELISAQELCDRTGMTPSTLRRYHDMFSRTVEDPIPPVLYTYKATVIVEKVATVDWLDRLYASMIASREQQLREATEFLDKLGGPDSAHISPRLGFGKERQRGLKRVREARETVSKAPKKLKNDREILAALREMYKEMAE
ncbi:MULTISPECIES: hypothetical protein [Streptomyces]|uniref:HTH merR-type domain-containing protein n=2 Tax=Streptomyces TaxID=1883 RepID=A0ABV9IX31_9ACTN